MKTSTIRAGAALVFVSLASCESIPESLSFRSLTPDTVGITHASLELMLEGTGFTRASGVFLEGPSHPRLALASEMLSSKRLRALVPERLLIRETEFLVWVEDPGGDSDVTIGLPLLVGPGPPIVTGFSPQEFTVGVGHGIRVVADRITPLPP